MNSIAHSGYGSCSPDSQLYTGHYACERHHYLREAMFCC